VPRAMAESAFLLDILILIRSICIDPQTDSE
jgi:hypothetical protein